MRIRKKMERYKLKSASGVSANMAGNGPLF